MSPVTTNLNVGLGILSMGNKEPGTEDNLGQYVKYGINDNFSVDGDSARTIGDAPNTRRAVNKSYQGVFVE